MTVDQSLESYIRSLDSMEGWFYPDAALLFMSYSQVANAQGIIGDSLEIGVHHGKSAIAVASLREPGRSFYEIDLFEELQSQNRSQSGLGNKGIFLTNMRAMFGDLSFVRCITGASANLRPDDLGSNFSFCHIDGGHSAEETYGDLCLCAQILVPGGLLAIDDYFNPEFPGVGEGAVRFMLEHKNELRPVAIGFNKVIFQKLPAQFDIHKEFSSMFPALPKSKVTLWDQPAALFQMSLLPFFDLKTSALGHLRPNAGLIFRAEIDPIPASVHGSTGKVIRVPVRVANRSSISFTWSKNPILLSYHLLSEDGAMRQFDNPRCPLGQTLHPGEERVVELPIYVPEEPGTYQVEIDIVWEGVMWFKDKGSPTAKVTLVASSS